MRDRQRRVSLIVAVNAAIVMLGGCARYVTPGGPADWRALGVTDEIVGRQTDYTIAEKLQRKPLATFPAAVAVVRVQDSGYRSYSASGYGSGRYSVVSVRDVESDEQFARISRLPMMRGLAPLNRLVLPGRLDSDLELREGAANVQADMLFIYTLDTVFDVRSQIPPMGVITLGLFPDEEARVTCTASGVLMDTRNGYVYGLAEGSAGDQSLANAWTSAAAVDRIRRSAEAEAFESLVAEFERMWRGVVAQYGPPEGSG
jgi:hypothetical protein